MQVVASRRVIILSPCRGGELGIISPVSLLLSELLHTLFDCKDSAEIMSRGYENALLLVTKTIDKVMTGELELKDLIVSKILRQDLYKYRSLFPHVSAALQLTTAGVPLTRGDTIQYIYTDAAHSNPLRRVTPVEFIEEGKEQIIKSPYPLIRLRD